MTLGQRIQMYRKRRGLSQEQLGDQVGVSRQAVSKWEQDTARPDINKVVALAQLFELSTDALLKGVPDEPEDDGTIWSVDPDAPFRGWRGRSLPFTQFQKVCRAVGCLLLAGCGIYLLTVYQSLPQTIPTHWNAAGAIDGWGSKNTIWWLYLLGVVLYGSMEVLNCFPAIWNVGGNLTEGNWKRVYTVIRSTVEGSNCILAVLFIYLSVMVVHPQLPEAGPIFLLLAVYTLVFTAGFVYAFKVAKT